MNEPTPEQLQKLPKWAQEAFATIQKKALIANALRFTEPVAADVIPPEPGSGNALRTGWMFNAHSACVSKACTSSVYHSSYTDEKTTTQGPRSLYSTRLLALKALRFAMETEFSYKLAKVDEEIAKESKP